MISNFCFKHMSNMLHSFFLQKICLGKLGIRLYARKQTQIIVFSFFKYTFSIQNFYFFCGLAFPLDCPRPINRGLIASRRWANTTPSILVARLGLVPGLPNPLSYMHAVNRIYQKQQHYFFSFFPTSEWQAGTNAFSYKLSTQIVQRGLTSKCHKWRDE